MNTKFLIFEFYTWIGHFYKFIKIWNFKIRADSARRCPLPCAAAPWERPPRLAAPRCVPLKVSNLKWGNSLFVFYFLIKINHKKKVTYICGFDDSARNARLQIAHLGAHVVGFGGRDRLDRRVTGREELLGACQPHAVQFQQRNQIARWAIELQTLRELI